MQSNEHIKCHLLVSSAEIDLGEWKQEETSGESYCTPPKIYKVAHCKFERWIFEVFFIYRKHTAVVSFNLCRLQWIACGF